MKIHFDTAYGNRSVGNSAIAYGQPAASAKDTKGSYQTGISGTVMDNNAYAGHGRTAEDIMAEAGRQDVATQRNYMAVMSNSMSEEDFKKLQEEGFHPGEQDIKKIVTILDKIKAELLKAGETVAGYTDTLDRETLAQITGSENYANTIVDTFARYDVPLTRENVTKAVQAAEESLQLEELSDGAVKYMVQNRMEPSLQNLYVAQHGTNGREKQSGGYYSTEAGGYYARKADHINWEQLTPAMEQAVKEACLTAAEEPTLEDAKWLVEQGIELNAENLNRLRQIRSIALPPEPKAVIEASAIAIADGLAPDRIALDSRQTAGQQAADIQEAVLGITQEAADIAGREAQDGTLNLKALRAAQLRIQGGSDTVSAQKHLAARRVLEEVRLHMTLEANIKLIKSNFAIETAPMEELIEALKQAQQEIEGTLFEDTENAPASEKARIYNQTIQQTAELSKAPAAIVGRIAAGYRDITLTELGVQAASLQKSYEKAEQSYEALMTAPRRDLGDSIRSAFCNVEDILTDMGLETTETNCRAVRILGYNSMDITQENIAQVKAADLTVQNIIEKMTPAAVLHMIRDGKNPLSMNIGDLDSYFSEQDNPQQEMERYSKFLYRLEQNKEITPEEKTSYIGICRMLRQLEKNDGAAVGSLVEQGLELTFSNLLGAVRTSKKGGVDVSIDDSVGGIGRKETGMQDITSQIQTAFQKELHTIREQLSPEVLKQGGFSQEATVEAFYEAVRKEAGSEESEQAATGYRREELAYYRKAAAVSEAAVEELLAYGQTVSTDYVMAAQSLLYQRGGMWKKALEKQDQKQLQAKLEELQDGFTCGPEAKEAYSNYVEQVQDETIAAAQEEDTAFLPVKEKQMLHKQLTFCKNLSQEENYEIPVMVQGKLTSVNLRIIHTPDKQGKAAVTMESEEYGKIAGEFRAKGNEISGYLTCDSHQGREYLNSVRDKIEEGLGKLGYKADNLQVITAKELDLASFSQRVAEGREQAGEVPQEQLQSANILYQTAKLFLHNV